MAKRVPSVSTLIAAVLGIVLTTTTAHAASATRTSSFVYGAGGLLVKEIIEPGNPQLCLVTEYGYDAFGNKTSVTTRNCNGSAGEAVAPAAGTDGVIAPRSTGSTYDARGQFPLTTTNALGHSETRTFDPKFGAVASLTGPNGLPTSWTYDSFGRKKTESRADGTTTVWDYKMPCDLPNNDLAYDSYCVSVLESSSPRAQRAYYDTLNRKLATVRINFGNNLWMVDSRVDYDAWGRVNKSYLTYQLGSPALAKYASLEYDLLGRVTKETAPDNTTSTTDNPVTTKTYAGLTSTVTNAKGQVTTTLKNTQGQTVTVTDAQGKTIGYSYDPFGNLTKTTDVVSNITVLTYDLRGRKIGMDDPDMGVWTYAYNALGELIRQTDAKGQIVTMVYDKLGRMTSRSEPDLNSYWAYDQLKNAQGLVVANGKGIGKLAKAWSDNSYSREHTYDDKGRLIETRTIIDDPAKPYVTKVAYDNYGRVDTQTYPASPAHPTGFAVKNVYNTVGYLTQVVNAATPTKVYWTANAMDAMGHLTQQTYGNGVVTQQVYDPATGRLQSQLAGAGNAVQNMSYTYDSLGNLSTRTDVNQNLTETYTYDTLNRITTAVSISGAVNVSSSFTYNAIGNIATKSDVGTYYYPGVTGARQPHAVGRIDGAANASGIFHRSFLFYDANGNNTSMSQGDYTAAGVLVAGTQGTRSIAWTSFNMPAQISNCLPGAACKTTSFLYNPEHERTIENQADGSKVVVLSPRYDTGLHFEKKLIAANGALTGAVEYEHYLYAGGLMFGKYVTITQTDGVTLASAKTTYYSKDHLGSIVAITDEAGAVVERLSYDVWGKRRYPNGAADPNGLLNNPDMYHGYTGHEMLDAVGLIHMNGRLYDPLTARFVSADFLIQSPDNLQSYNRYSYGWNNPLSGTDPSGQLFGIDDWLIAAIVTSIFVPEVRPVVAIAVSIVAPFSSPFMNGFVAGMVGSGGDLQSGLVSGMTAGMFDFVGAEVLGKAGSLPKVLAHAAVGCASAAMGGGDCGRGAVSAGFAEFAGAKFGSDWGEVGQTIKHAVLGGTASALGGGKFASGAITGAFGYLYESGRLRNYEKASEMGAYRMEVDFANGDYGHYWTETSATESYGRWPSKQVGFVDTVMGVPGVLNGGETFGGTSTRDPHHGDRGSNVKEYDIYVKKGTAVSALATDIKTWAQSYTGNWAYPATPFTGQNCHSFQEQLLNKFDLKIQRRAP